MLAHPTDASAGAIPADMPNSLTTAALVCPRRYEMWLLQIASALGGGEECFMFLRLSNRGGEAGVYAVVIASGRG